MTGLRLLPEGQRKTAVTDAIETVLAAYGDSMLPYDEPAARH